MRDTDQLWGEPARESGASVSIDVGCAGSIAGKPTGTPETGGLCALRSIGNLPCVTAHHYCKPFYSGIF
jgi:hypothetical protein